MQNKGSETPFSFCQSQLKHTRPTIKRRWSYGDAPNGGILTSLAISAARRVTSRQHQDPLSVSTYFVKKVRREAREGAREGGKGLVGEMHRFNSNCIYLFRKRDYAFYCNSILPIHASIDALFPLVSPCRRWKTRLPSCTLHLSPPPAPKKPCRYV